MRALITGCPRSGTGYMAQVLVQLGVKVGHEWVFNLDPPVLNPDDCNTILDRPSCADVDVDVSWLAAPWYEFLEFLPGIPTLHLVREPWDVMRSLARMEFFTHHESVPYAEYVLRFDPTLRKSNDVVNLARFWLGWQSRLQRCRLLLRTEDCTENPPLAFCLLRRWMESPGVKGINLDVFEAAVRAVSTRYNHRDRGGLVDHVTPEALGQWPKLADAVEAQRQIIGYSRPWKPS